MSNITRQCHTNSRWLCAAAFNTASPVPARAKLIRPLLYTIDGNEEEASVANPLRHGRAADVCASGGSCRASHRWSIR